MPVVYHKLLLEVDPHQMVTGFCAFWSVLWAAHLTIDNVQHYL